MKRREYILILVLLIYAYSFASQRILVEFSGAKLSTVVEAISQATNVSVIWDKDAVVQKDKLVYVSIKRYTDSEKLLNTILLENGLIAVKENDIYKIRVADEYMFSISPEIIRTLGKDVFDSVLYTIKSNVSSSALVEIDRNLYTVYIRDSKDNINKIKLLMTQYIDSMKKEMEVSKEKGNLYKKEVQISYENFKAVEDRILEALSPIGRYDYDKQKGTLIVYDTKDNILQLSRLLGKITNVKLETKCFYFRGLEPGEVLQTIKENYLSENGIVIFKTKEVSITESGERKLPLANLPATAAQQQPDQTQTTTASTFITSLPKICVTDTSQVIEKIKYQFMDSLLDRPYQISIEARIVQISSRSLRDLGIQWGGQMIGNDYLLRGINSGSRMGLQSGYAVDFPATQAAPSGGFSIGTVFGGLSDFIDIRLSALEKIGQSKVLSKPQILTIDGETAEITQGYEIPYTTVVAAGGGSVASVAFKKAVLRLNVSPRTTADGNIIINLSINQDIPDFKNLLLGTPPIQTKTINSKVVVKDGAVIAIGGILEKSDDFQDAGVPWLMRVPIFGYLFKNKFKQESSNELLIFISPKIIYH